MHHLRKKLFYMNPCTGSVAKGEEWLEDFLFSVEFEKAWHEWGGHELMQVTKNDLGQWTEYEFIDEGFDKILM